MSLLEGAAQTLLGKVLVARKGDLAHLHARVAIDAEDYVYGIIDRGVVGDLGVYLHIAEALADELLLDELLVAVDHIVRELGIGAQSQLLAQVVGLAARDTLATEVPAIYAGALLKDQLNIDAVAIDRSTHLHIREVALIPQTRD